MKNARQSRKKHGKSRGRRKIRTVRRRGGQKTVRFEAPTQTQETWIQFRQDSDGNLAEKTVSMVTHGADTEGSPVTSLKIYKDDPKTPILFDPALSADAVTAEKLMALYKRYVSDPVPAENRADATYTVLIYTQTNQGNGLLSDIVIIQNDDEIVHNVPVFIEWYEKKYRRSAATAAPAAEPEARGLMAPAPEEKVVEVAPEEKMATMAPVPEVTARAPTVVPEEVAPVPEEPPVPPETTANLNPVNVSSAEEFNRLVASYPVAFVKFTAPWCIPCQTIQPTWVGLSRQYASSNNVFIEVDIEYNQGLSDTYDVRQIPTFLVFKDKKGYKPDISITKSTLEQMVREHSAK